MNEEDYKSVIRLLRKQSELLLDISTNFNLDFSVFQEALKISELIEEIITANFIGDDDDTAVEEMLS